MCVLVNIKKYKLDNYIYIGEDFGEKYHFGNPFYCSNDKFSNIPKYANREKLIIFDSTEESIFAYEDWLLGEDYKNYKQERRLWILDNLKNLKRKILGCYCKPFPCHGDILVKMVKILEKEEKNYEKIK